MFLPFLGQTSLTGMSFFLFIVSADSTRVSNPSSEGGYPEGVYVLCFAQLPFLIATLKVLPLLLFLQIWNAVRKPEVYKEAALSEFFNVSA